MSSASLLDDVHVPLIIIGTDSPTFVPRGRISQRLRMSLISTIDLAEQTLRRVRDQAGRVLRAWVTDSALARLIAQLGTRKYRPERCYMRGPGPKAKAKANAQARHASKVEKGGRSSSARSTSGDHA